MLREVICHTKRWCITKIRCLAYVAYESLASIFTLTLSRKRIESQNYPKDHVFFLLRVRFFTIATNDEKDATKFLINGVLTKKKHLERLRWRDAKRYHLFIMDVDMHVDIDACIS